MKKNTPNNWKKGEIATLQQLQEFQKTQAPDCFGTCDLTDINCNKCAVREHCMALNYYNLKESIKEVRATMPNGAFLSEINPEKLFQNAECFMEKVIPGQTKVIDIMESVKKYLGNADAQTIFEQTKNLLHHYGFGATNGIVIKKEVK